ncbi:MAG TPA: serine hydrolase domain-containing protein, partial [Archangium sp.]
MKGLWLPFLLVGLTAWASPPGVPLCERPHAVAPVQERPFPEEVQRALDALVRAELAREPNHAGLAVGVLRGGERWVGAYGLRDVARGLPATPRTTWRMASITKSFTAVAVMQLVEQGRLSLDTDIHTLVPAWPEARRVTARQLLGHLGGVTNYGRFGPSHDSGPVDTAGALALVTGYELEAEPGTRFIYSTWAYNLLGAAIEAVSGQRYGEYLQEHVFGPAGMEHAALDDRRTRDEHHAAGYRLRDGQRVPSKVIDVSGRFAGGGTRASIEDLLGFGGALLDYRLVSRTSTGWMQTPMSTR